MDRPDPVARRAQLDREIALAKHAAANRALDLRHLMSLREFRRFVYSELVAAGLYAESADLSNANATYYHEGKRAHGLRLARELEALDGELFLRMMKEAVEDKQVKKEMEK